MRADWRARLDAELEASQGYKANSADWLDGRWADIKAARDDDDPRRGNTGAPLETLKQIGQEDHERARRASTLHRDHPALPGQPPPGDRDRRGHRLGDRRGARVLLAAARRPPVRLSGQDTERGTFSQRHSVLVDQENEDRYIPFNITWASTRRASRSSTRCSRRRRCSASNTATRSPSPNALTLWEAQFGDFANGAQVVFDQFVSSGERKWLRMSGLVLPAAARLRGAGAGAFLGAARAFLQMCAEDNMQVANCTTPANYFHILRRQLKRDIRKPLILMTPKSAAAPQARGVAAG